MPHGWYNPKLFIRYKNVKIYHTYRNDEITDVNLYHFTTDSTAAADNDKFSFDIRDLPQPTPPKGKGHLKDEKPEDQKLIIKHAIESGLIKVPENT